ncbi:MAG: SDR family oxidoreductase [Anaerolineae bacterium]
MRVLILGAGGMLGHKLVQRYQGRYETLATARSSLHQYPFFNPEHIITGVDAFNFDTIVKAISTAQPDVVINCIGIVKQLPTAKDPIVSITINALFPHRVAQLCAAAGARFIHISTDCVFNGRKGMYTEDDPSDAEDLYGRSKFLGEVDHLPNALTLRTSIIGRELGSASGLVEWFLSNRGGQVRGFRQALYTGFTTQAMADILADVIDHHPDLHGVYQVSSDVINKYDLLLLLREAYNTPTEIEPYDAFQIDRSLDSSRFRAATGFTPPSWSQMIQTMAADPDDQWKD